MTHWHQQHPPHDEIFLMSGDVPVGVIVPPFPKLSEHWSYMLTVGQSRHKFKHVGTRSAAENALLADWHDWLRNAGLAEKGEG